MSSNSLFRSVFITGANRGIGLELVKGFLSLSPAPEHVFATVRRLESATDLKNLESENPNLHLIELDVTDFNALPKVVGKVTEMLNGKGLNVLFNNAGVIDRSKVDEVTVDGMMQVYKVNAVAPLMITQAFLPLLKKAGADKEDRSTLKAWILNMSSKIASIEDNESGRRYPYRASKAALNIINKSLSVDLKSDGINAVVLHPGWVQTDMGGPRALVSTSECVAGLMKVMSSLDETKTGMFFDYSGKVIPW